MKVDRSTESRKEPGHRHRVDLDTVLRWIIKGILDNRVLTQVEICCITGVSRASLTQWLADPEKTITFSTASKLIGLVGLRKFMLLAERHSGREAMEGVNLDQFRKQQQWREQREAIISQTVRDFQERYQTGRVEPEDQEDQEDASE